MLKSRMLGLDGRILDDALYEIIAVEIEQGKKDPVAWTRAIEEAGDNSALLQAAYIKNRLRRLRDEIAIAKEEGCLTEGLPEAKKNSKKSMAIELENQRLIRKAELQQYRDQQRSEDELRVDKRPLIILFLLLVVILFAGAI